MYLIIKMMYTIYSCNPDLNDLGKNVIFLKHHMRDKLLKIVLALPIVLAG